MRLGSQWNERKPPIKVQISDTSTSVAEELCRGRTAEESCQMRIVAVASGIAAIGKLLGRRRIRGLTRLVRLVGRV